MWDHRLYIQDILDSVKKIQGYTKGISKDKFSKNSLILDAVARNLEIIGEASKRIPSDVKKQIPNIPWKKIVGLRNMLIHEYSGIDKEIIWDIIENKLDVLAASLKPFIAVKKHLNKKTR